MDSTRIKAAENELPIHLAQSHKLRDLFEWKMVIGASA
jgi:hypothetical protein